MIKLDVQEYCHDCLDFVADVERGQKCVIDDFASFTGSRVYQTDTIVRCKYRNRCKAIKRYLEKEAQNAENSGDQSGVCGAGQAE